VAEPETADQLAARFDGRAATYDESETHRLIANATAEFADVSGVQDVLDAGTGTGLVLRALAPRLSEPMRLVGVDLSSRMLEVAQAALPNGEFLTGDAAHLPFDDSTFDLVTCATAIHLMPDTQAVLREWTRVLRPSGHIVIATFTSVLGWGHLVVPANEAADTGLRVLRSVDWASPADSGFPDIVIVELSA
jgi:ubiquinone/menaquinone biosynthesis C-methylase UbiE